MGDGPPELRAELALLIGALRTTPQMTGSRLLDFSREPDQKK
jgi:hypothetical protein